MRRAAEREDREAQQGENMVMFDISLALLLCEPFTQLFYV